MLSDVIMKKRMKKKIEGKCKKEKKNRLVMAVVKSFQSYLILYVYSICVFSLRYFTIKINALFNKYNLKKKQNKRQKKQLNRHILEKNHRRVNSLKYFDEQNDGQKKTRIETERQVRVTQKQQQLRKL